MFNLGKPRPRKNSNATNPCREGSRILNVASALYLPNPALPSHQSSSTTGYCLRAHQPRQTAFGILHISFGANIVELQKHVACPTTGLIHYLDRRAASVQGHAYSSFKCILDKTDYQRQNGCGTLSKFKYMYHLLIAPLILTLPPPSVHLQGARIRAGCGPWNLRPHTWHLPRTSPMSLSLERTDTTMLIYPRKRNPRHWRRADKYYVKPVPDKSGNVLTRFHSVLTLATW